MRVCAGGCRQAESRRLLQLVKVGKAERWWTWGGRRVETRAGHLASSCRTVFGLVHFTKWEKLVKTPLRFVMQLK